MKIPSAPRGLSVPPTIVKPSDFFPGPFSNVMVWNEHIVDFGRLGNVQKFEFADLSNFMSGTENSFFPISVKFSLDFSFFSFNLSSSQRFMVIFSCSMMGDSRDMKLRSKLVDDMQNLGFRDRLLRFWLRDPIFGSSLGVEVSRGLNTESDALERLGIWSVLYLLSLFSILEKFKS